MYDCAIIGSGAAGISAALTLKSLGRNFIWFGRKNLSAKIRKAEKIRNYPGLSAVSGLEMQSAFLRQINDMGVGITEKTVTGVYATDDGFTILCNDETFEARAVILATGVEAVKPISGENEFLGRGVSYCAVCDGFLYRGKKIAAVCTSKESEHEIEYLASLAEKVYVFATYKSVEIKAGNIEIFTAIPTEICGNERAEKLIYTGGEVMVDGVFMLRESIAPSALVHGLEVIDGHVVCDRACATNIKGCFAAGDCTGRPYQYAKAAGEGNVAAHSVNAYLTKPSH